MMDNKAVNRVHKLLHKSVCFLGLLTEFATHILAKVQWLFCTEIFTRMRNKSEYMVVVSLSPFNICKNVSIFRKDFEERKYYHLREGILCIESSENECQEMCMAEQGDSEGNLMEERNLQSLTEGTCHLGGL